MEKHFKHIPESLNLYTKKNDDIIDTDGEIWRDEQFESKDYNFI